MKPCEDEIVNAIAEAWHKQGKLDMPFDQFRAGFIAGLQWLSAKFSIVNKKAMRGMTAKIHSINKYKRE